MRKAKLAIKHQDEGCKLSHNLCMTCFMVGILSSSPAEKGRVRTCFQTASKSSGQRNRHIFSCSIWNKICCFHVVSHKIPTVSNASKASADTGSWPYIWGKALSELCLIMLFLLLFMKWIISFIKSKTALCKWPESLPLCFMIPCPDNAVNTAHKHTNLRLFHFLHLFGPWLILTFWSIQRWWLSAVKQQYAQFLVVMIHNHGNVCIKYTATNWFTLNAIQVIVISIPNAGESATFSQNLPWNTRFYQRTTNLRLEARCMQTIRTICWGSAVMYPIFDTLNCKWPLLCTEFILYTNECTGNYFKLRPQWVLLQSLFLYNLRQVFSQGH